MRACTMHAVMQAFWHIHRPPSLAYRPFMWKGKVYASHGVWLGSGEGTKDWGTMIWQCLTELDFDNYVMKLEYCFDRLPIREGVIQ